ncbi:TolC family protein [Burkholderia sp. F1]|uniref:TolC family protein n=1 Tax=Burkholderia sp. F1 TaxID=3366817 RepID=UPI003D72F44B
MHKHARLLAGLLVIPIHGTTWSAERLEPSQATMGHTRSVSLNGETVDVSLQDAVFLALRGNRQIRSAYLGRIAQKFDLRVAEDRFTPKLVLAGQYSSARNQDGNGSQGALAPTATLLSKVGTQFSLSWTSLFSRTGNNGRFQDDGVTLQVIQPLLRGAGSDIATAPVRLARLAEERNKLDLQSAVSQTVTQTVIAYRELLRAQAQLQITRDALARSGKLLEMNQALIAAGRMAAVDIVQTEANVATQELDVEEAHNRLASSRATLLQLIGVDLTTRIRASDDMRAETTAIGLAQAEDVALSHQPDYLKQLIAQEEAKINLAVAKNNRLWDVSLVAGAGQGRDRVAGDFGTFSNRHWQGYVGVQVQIPIGDLTLRQADVHAAVGVETTKVQAAESEVRLRKDVDDAVRDVLSRWRQYQISQRALDLSRRTLEIEHEKLQVGRSNNFQVLSFETALRSAENARLNALIGYLNAQTELDQRLGMTLQSWDISLND